MATISRTISSFSVYDGYDQGEKLQTKYIAYSNSFVIPNENLSNVTLQITFTGIDSSDNELSSAVNNMTNCVFIESSKVGSGNTYTGDTTSQVSNWVFNKGKTVCLSWLHQDMISTLEGIDGDVVNYIISGYVKFETASGQVIKFYLGSNSLPTCYLGSKRIEKIYLGSNLILSAGTKSSLSTTYSGKANTAGKLVVSKNLGTGVDSGTIRIIDSSTATVETYSYNKTTGVFSCTLKGMPQQSFSGTIYYDKYS